MNTADPLFQPGCALDEVIVTDGFEERSRSVDVEAQRRALGNLNAVVDETPEIILQALVENVLVLCDAQSAGVSVEDLSVEPAIFRWHAVAGRLSPFLGGTMPRDFSPCGTTLSRNRPTLMRELVRYYPYARQLNIALEEVLLVPFAVGGRGVGTVWIVAHTPDRHFGPEEVNCINNLVSFASAAVTLLETRRRIESTNERLERQARKITSHTTPPVG